MKRVAVTLALFYAAICLAVFLLQRKLIYFPTPATDPAMQLRTGDVTLNISARIADTPDAILYFGGNAEDVSITLLHFQDFFPEHALYMPHYRGYGGSTGSPGEAALHRDALLVYDTIRARHHRVTVIGRSLGSGVAAGLAGEREPLRLILVTPFDSMVSIAKSRYPFLPVSLLLIDRYDSRRSAPHITAPTLLLAAEHDEIVPFHSTQRLHRAFSPGVSTLLTIRNSSHNTLDEFPEYMEAIREWIGSASAEGLR